MKIAKRLVRMAICASVFAACGDATTSPEGPNVAGDASTSCTPGEAERCTGPSECAGSRVCITSGEFGACRCGNDPRDAAREDVTDGAPAITVSVSAEPIAVTSTVTTLAGSGQSSFADGTGVTASFRRPIGVAADAAGTVFVGDEGNNRIRKITAAGVVSTLAGSNLGGFADGTGAAATFRSPAGVALNAAGDILVADRGNHRIRKVTAAGVVTTLAGSGTPAFADGTGAAAAFNAPAGVAVDAAGTVYVADMNNHRLRKVTPAGVVTTLAGSGTSGYADGTGATARFSQPAAVAVDAAGTVYVADTGNNRIRKITAAGVVTTVAGSGSAGFADGSGAGASFNVPEGIAIDPGGNLFVVDRFSHRVRAVSITGVVSTLAGSGTSGYDDGTGVTSRFLYPEGVTADPAGKVYVGDSQNNRIRKLDPRGVGQLAVTWSAPSAAAKSAITGYAASARAAGQTTGGCTAATGTTCTIGGLTGGVSYEVLVKATLSDGSTVVSLPVVATPN